MKVLFATDGFEPANDAGTLIEKIGDRDRINVTVMSVTHAGIPAPEHMPLMLDPVPSRREDTLEIVDGAVSRLLTAGFKAAGHTTEGHPGQEIVRVVEKDWYDLVVMGSGNRTWLGARLLGSVSTYVLHSSPWSLLVVHEALPGDKGRVLVGTDGSRGAEFTVQTLARFADPARTEITVVSVIPPNSPLLMSVPGPTYISAETLEHNEELERRMRERGQRHADGAATFLRDAGFEAEARIDSGNPTEQLLKEADSGRFDLVTVGSRGLGPFRRALLGSVSDHVVRHSRAALVGRRLTT
ncbi:MAG: universal stress protein [Actinomycetota bacterium]|nr:universal stress protein [Actinomycetota bacterium]